MTISYTGPLSAAWRRMKTALFARPFPIEGWFVTGFSAWLAEIFSNSSHGFSSGWRKDDHHDLNDLQHVGDWLSHPAVLAGLAAVLCAVLVVTLVLAWVSARAQFVFLDNVVRGRAAFVAPWKRSGRLGMSLFLWHAAMSFAWLVPVACLLVPFAPLLASAFAGDATWSDSLALGVLVGVGAAILCGLALLVVYLLNDNFVIPLMWKYDEGAVSAWRRFGALLAAHPGDFGAYLAFTFILAIGAFVAVVLAGLLTCCVGLALAVIPYIGVVVTLPVYYVFRALGPEFLRQYGPEWDVWAEAPGPGEPTAEPSLPPLA